MKALALGAVVLIGLTPVLHSEIANGAEPVTADGQGRYTLVLAAGTPVKVIEEGLTVVVVDVKDGRCPQQPDMACVWGGHAAVTLRVTRDGAEPQTIVIGTRAPPSMNLPYDATVGAYRFSLLQLEPGNKFLAKRAVSEYTATVVVAKQ